MKLTTADVAKRLGVSRRTAHRLIDRAGVGTRDAGRRIVDEADLPAIEAAAARNASALERVRFAAGNEAWKHREFKRSLGEVSELERLQILAETEEDPTLRALLEESAREMAARP